MYERSLTKPDGRALTLYSRRPIPEGLQAPSPGTEPPGTKAHLRWHPLRGEWVAYASHRQNRTFLPPPEYNPLAPTTDPAHPTELPAGDYDVAVFENRFPTLTGRAEVPAPPSIVPTRPGKGACEVVVFTQDPSSSLGALPLDHLELLLEVWADRYRKLGAREDVDYVMPFENRGVEVGVTLHHPHGQIYAYPFVPPVLQRELAAGARHRRKTGRCLYCDVIAREKGGPRTVIGDERWLAFVPEFARWPYEVHLAPIEHRGGLPDLDEQDDESFALTLKGLLQKYDRLFGKPLPYVMAMHQRPPGRGHGHHHFHVEFYPPNRMRDKLKYLAGSEQGAGTFISDTLPEESAGALREAIARAA